MARFMNEAKKEKHFWKYYFGINRLEDIKPEVYRFNFRDSTEFTDEFLERITARVKIIHRLDLDSTPVTDEGIQYLRRLDYLQELRLKGCRQLTKKCVEVLRSLVTLELLHLGGTMLDIDDAKNLAALKSLKFLLVEAGRDEEQAKEKAGELKQLIPACEIVVSLAYGSLTF